MQGQWKKHGGRVHFKKTTSCCISRITSIFIAFCVSRTGYLNMHPYFKNDQVLYNINQRQYSQVSFQQSPNKRKWSLQPGLLCLYQQKDLTPLLISLPVFVQVEKITLVSGVIWSMTEGTALMDSSIGLLLVERICQLISTVHAFKNCLMKFSRFLRFTFGPLSSFEVPFSW